MDIHSPLHFFFFTGKVLSIIFSHKSHNRNIEEPGQVLEHLAFGSRYAIFETVLGCHPWLNSSVEMDLIASSREYTECQTHEHSTKCWGQ